MVIFSLAKAGIMQYNCNDTSITVENLNTDLTEHRFIKFLQHKQVNHVAYFAIQNNTYLHINSHDKFTSQSNQKLINALS